MSKDNVLLFVYPPTGSQKCPRYAFAGGNKNHGNVTTVYGQGASDISVELVEDERPRRYRIVGIDFSGPGKGQMSVRSDARAKKAAGSYKAVIDNDADGPANVAYNVRIEDGATREVFTCHPMIKNVPPAW